MKAGAGLVEKGTHNLLDAPKGYNDLCTSEGLQLGMEDAKGS